MPHVTCAFSTFGVQNVIPNGCWSVTAITPKKPSAWEDHRKPNSIWNSQRGTVAVNELMQWLICLAFMWQLCFLWGFRLRVTPLSLIPSCVTHYKTSSEHLFPWVTLNRLGERGNTPGLKAILYFGKWKRFVGRRRLESPSLLCFMNQLRGERRL